MSMVEFNHTVKYRGVFHAPHTSVEVNNEDIEELVALGAKVLSQSQQDMESTSKSQETKVVKKTPYKIPPPKKEK